MVQPRMHNHYSQTAGAKVPGLHLLYKVKLKAAILLALLGCTTLIRATTPDSLFLEIAQQPTPEKKVNKQLEYVYSLLSAYSTDSALSVIDPLITQYDKQQFTYAEARAKSLKSWLLQFASKYEESLLIAHEALKLQKSINAGR